MCPVFVQYEKIVDSLSEVLFMLNDKKEMDVVAAAKVLWYRCRIFVDFLVHLDKFCIGGFTDDF